jgi:hypothetical protein
VGGSEQVQTQNCQPAQTIELKNKAQYVQKMENDNAFFHFLRVKKGGLGDQIV